MCNECIEREGEMKRERERVKGERDVDKRDRERVVSIIGLSHDQLTMKMSTHYTVRRVERGV